MHCFNLSPAKFTPFKLRVMKRILSVFSYYIANNKLINLSVLRNVLTTRIGRNRFSALIRTAIKLYIVISLSYIIVKINCLFITVFLRIDKNTESLIR